MCPVAFDLYGGILTEVERAGYQALGRVTITTPGRAGSNEVEGWGADAP